MSAPDPIITRPVMRYHGGKFRLAPWVLQFFPKHSGYCEPYGGSASLLMLKPRVGAEIYNDLDGDVVNVFRILRDPVTAAELKRRVELTPFAREEFDWSYEPAIDELDAAHKLIVRSFFGHGSDAATRGCRTGFRSKRTDERALPSQEWATWPDAIPAFTRRLRGVMIENRNALEVIERFDSPQSLIFADPPYVHSTRSAMKQSSTKNGYRHEMDDIAHRELAQVLRGAESMVVLCGYPSDLYDRELYPDWERYERRHMADGGKARTEVVWINEACAAGLHKTRGGLFA